MKGFAIVMMVVMADIVVNLTPIPNTVPETQPVVVETQAPTQAQTEAYIPPRKEGTIYRIYGITPSEDWQRYLYAQLDARGYGWFMPYAVCQIFQESRWNQWSDNGRDFGLTQQKGIYWSDRAALYGIPGADIWDPYAQLHVFACQMSGYLAETGNDVGRALSAYYLGTWDFSQRYVDCVMEHWGALEVVR